MLRCGLFIDKHRCLPIACFNPFLPIITKLPTDSIPCLSENPMLTYLPPDRRPLAPTYEKPWLLLLLVFAWLWPGVFFSWLMEQRTGHQRRHQ